MTGSATCNGLGCDSTTLIEAHVIPRAHANFCRQGGFNYVLTTDTKRKTPQLGEFDKTILCGECDNRLGVLDKYGFEVSRDFDMLAQNEGDAFVLPTVDATKFSKAILAI